MACPARATAGGGRGACGCAGGVRQWVATLKIMAYYNDNEAFACQVIANNIVCGRLPAGRVHCADVRTVAPDDLRGHRQLHLFAGIGAAAYACQLAGVPADFSICVAGFPCQDISCAGAQEGIEGARSALFWHLMRLIEGVRPTWILLENVPNLRTAGRAKDPDGLSAVELVIHALEAASYCVLPPIVVGADDVGAPHRRKRVWIVCRLADADFLNWWKQQQQPERWGRMGNATGGGTRPVSTRPGPEGSRAPDADGANFGVAHANGGSGGTSGANHGKAGAANAPVGTGGGLLADANGGRFGVNGSAERQGGHAYQCGAHLADRNGAGFSEWSGVRQDSRAQQSPVERSGDTTLWPARPGQPQNDWEQPRTTTVQAALESALGGAVAGASARLVRRIECAFGGWRRSALRGLGNAWCAPTAVPILQWVLAEEREIIAYSRCYAVGNTNAK